MLYGALGRTGVYHAQDILKLIAAGADDATRLDVARRLIKGLPETNWLARNRYVRDHLDGGDAGLYDLLLHSRDRAYTVPEIGAMVEAAGLAITGFIEPALYDPANYLADSELTPRVAALPWLERCAVAELLGGTLKRHTFYVVAKRRAAEAVAAPDDRRAVPLLRDADGAAMAGPLRAGGRIKAELDGVALSYPVLPLAAAILAAIDGKRDLGEIQRRVGRAAGRSLNRDESAPPSTRSTRRSMRSTSCSSRARPSASPAFSPRTGAARRISADRLGKVCSAMLAHRASALTRPVVRDPPPLRVAPGGAGAASKALTVAQATLGSLLLADRRPPDAMTRLSLVRNPG